MLFEKKTQKALKYVWMFLGVLIMASMVLFLVAGLLPGGYTGIGF